MNRRLFIGFPLSETTKQAIDRQLIDLPGKKVPLQNWHITLEFLGDVPEDRIEILKAQLKQLPLPNSLTVHFIGVSAFRSLQHAKIIWLEMIQENNALTKLHQELQSLLIQHEFQVESRPFVPHATISRLARSKSIGDWVSTLKFNTVSTTIKKIVLYESIQDEQGIYYRPLLEKNI